MGAAPVQPDRPYKDVLIAFCSRHQEWSSMTDCRFSLDLTFLDPSQMVHPRLEQSFEAFVASTGLQFMNRMSTLPYGGGKQLLKQPLLPLIQ